MQRIQFIRTNGNVPKTLPGQDHISGFLAYVQSYPASALEKEAFSEETHILPVSTIERAEQLGICSGKYQAIKFDEDNEIERDQDGNPIMEEVDPSWETKVLHHHLSETFRLNPGISLYVGLFAKPTGENYTFTEVKTLQNYTGGALRQVAVWCGHKELTAGDLTALQGIATGLQENDRPLSIGYAPKVTDVTSMPSNLAGAGKCNVSVIIGQAGKGIAADLYASEDNEGKVSVSGIGNWLGITSRAAVHQAISALKYFPTGIDLPAFGDGTLLRDLDAAVVEALDTARYLFFVTYDGFADSYFNDSHTMDAAISDYAYIENVRTMDKAVRGIRVALLPELGGELYVDEKTGHLASYTIEYLTIVANRPLEDMQKANELSGVSVEIDPNQNVLATSTVEFVIKQVGVGVLRKIKCTIGFASSL